VEPRLAGSIILAQVQLSKGVYQAIRSNLIFKSWDNDTNI